MKVTYLSHSGFYVDLEDVGLVFDYEKGKMPEEAKEKPLYIFASHRHGDHYNPQILTWGDSRNDVQYIFSGDIKTEPRENLTIMKPKETKQVGDLTIRTLRSTDEGVAFLVKYQGKVIYHAGDLNWWSWKGEKEAAEKRMEQLYKQEIETLKQETLDVAFLPLDPRQEEAYLLGFDWFARTISCNCLVPMHLWGDYGLIQTLCQDPKSLPYRDKIWKISQEGAYLVLDK